MLSVRAALAMRMLVGEALQADSKKDIVLSHNFASTGSKLGRCNSEGRMHPASDRLLPLERQLPLSAHHGHLGL